jgi:phosphatidylglycerophosphatase A
VKFIIKLIATFFYTGYFPIAGGTFASLVSVFIYILLPVSAPARVLFVFFLFLTGFLVSGRAEALLQSKDSGKIVIDEVASMSLICLFAQRDYLFLTCGFLCFRFFDIVKPPPIKRIEHMTGSKAVMLDDLAAALYTILALFLISRLQRAGILPLANIPIHGL